MPYPTSAASHLKCLLSLFVSAYICMCCFYFSATYVLMCFNYIYVLLCFVLCFYIWFWIALQIIAGGKTALPVQKLDSILGWLEMSLFRMPLVLLSASCYIWSSLYFYYFVFWYFFSISFWFILMFFHLIILNIFLLFIATDLLLVIVNSCLERHLPHGLLFVIANSTSISECRTESHRTKSHNIKFCIGAYH
jgi:hypothetical protein